MTESLPLLKSTPPPKPSFSFTCLEYVSSVLVAFFILIFLPFTFTALLASISTPTNFILLVEFSCISLAFSLEFTAVFVSLPSKSSVLE